MRTVNAMPGFSRPGPAHLSAGILLSLSIFAHVAGAQVVYVEQAVARGIDLTWSNNYPVGDFGSGIAMEDFDHDGDLDVFVGTKKGQGLGIYRNNGAGSFSPVTTLDISPDRDIKQVLFADLDNDGWRDLVLTVWNPNPTGTSFVESTIRLYRALPGGGFAAHHDAVVDSSMAGLATGVAAGDVDRDGDLDLYVSVWKPGTPDDTSRNRYLRNDGNWTFVDRAGALGIDDRKKSFQVMIADLSLDGWPDIVIAEDKRGGATYYESNGDGTFTDRTVASGLDGYLFVGGRYIDGMGLAVGDYDGDLDPDVYITNIFDGNILYRNDNGTFVDRSIQTGTESTRIGWGCTFFDCDNDLFQDLFVVNFGMSGAANSQDRLYRNQGDQTFVDIGPASGITLTEDGFGMAVGDLDGNGAVDILVSQGKAPIRLWMNEGSVGNWMQLELVGTTSNRDAVGATATVYTGAQAQFFEQHAGESYLSTHSHAMDVGLASYTRADSVRVWWPSGHTEVWTQLVAGQRHLLVEGSSAVPAVTAPALTAQWTASRLELSWEVFDPELFDRFELWRDGPAPTLMVSLPSEMQKTRYRWTDLDPRSEGSYILRSVLRQTGEVLTTILQAPRAPRVGELVVDPPRPNPFNPRVSLRFYLPDHQRPVLRILDRRGREVTRLTAPQGPGWHSVIWDGRDRSGRRVASGTYSLEVRSGARARSVTMSLVR